MQSNYGLQVQIHEGFLDKVRKVFCWSLSLSLSLKDKKLKSQKQRGWAWPNAWNMQYNLTLALQPPKLLEWKAAFSLNPHTTNYPLTWISGGQTFNGITKLQAAFGILSGIILLGRISSGGVSRTTPSIESYSSSRRANFLWSTFSNSISSRPLAFSAAWTCAKLA